PDYESLPAIAGRVDAAIWTLAQARDWAQMHPGWTAVVPRHAGGPLPIAYVLPPGAAHFRAYLEEWLELQQETGFAAAARDYWLLGRSRKPRRPRWNLLDALMERD